MDNNLQLTDDLRIRDYDAHQYVLEERTVGEKGERWSILSYNGSVSSLLRLSRLHFVAHRIAPVKMKAIEDFDNEWADQVATLPEKKGPPPSGGKKAKVAAA